MSSCYLSAGKAPPVGRVRATSLRVAPGPHGRAHARHRPARCPPRDLGTLFGNSPVGSSARSSNPAGSVVVVGHAARPEAAHAAAGWIQVHIDAFASKVNS